MSDTQRPILLVSGAGEGLAASIATTFAQADYDIVGLARSDRIAAHLTRLVREAGGTYFHCVCDLTQAGEVGAALRIACRVADGEKLISRDRHSSIRWV